MDEPFGAIDPITRHRLQEEFLDLQQRVRKTVVLVTHDLEEAVLLGDRIALMSQGGHLEQFATPGELLGAPASPFVAEFTGSDRSLRRLAVVGLKSADATPKRASPASDGAPRIRVGASLRDALVAVLDAPDGVAVVVDDAGADVGTIDARAVQAAARRSIEADGELTGP
jgi:osmoprotectant transport system ATP-binding protein